MAFLPIPDLSDPNVWVALLTLTALEIVLGIDNVVFISILADKLRENQREKARRIGLLLAMLMRIALLLSLAWIIGLTHPLFEIPNPFGDGGHAVTGRDLVLLFGGLFLLAKSTHEIHGALEGEKGRASSGIVASMSSVLVQIVLLDVVFSLDSVITAVGMTDEIVVMITAVIVSIAVMMAAAGPIARFVRTHPTVKMLALSFLILIGALLVAEGLGQHIDKGYVYFAMAFSLGVETLNLRLRKRVDKVELHPAYES